MEINVNGTEVTLLKCHCGKVPQMADVQKSLEDWKRDCGYCKEPIKITHLSLGDHNVPNGVDSWSGSCNYEPSMTVGSLMDGTPHKRIHKQCWEKIFGEKLP